MAKVKIRDQRRWCPTCGHLVVVIAVLGRVLVGGCGHEVPE
jgi:ribosomal protein S27AE